MLRLVQVRRCVARLRHPHMSAVEKPSPQVGGADVAVYHSQGVA